MWRTPIRYGAIIGCLPLTAGCDLSGATGPDGGCAPQWNCEGAPTLVAGLPALTRIEGAGWRTCGLTAEGAAWCWGTGGVSDVAVDPRPAAVAGGLAFTVIDGGRFHACGLSADSSAYCWGLTAGGLLCGVSECSVTPVKVGTRKYIALSVGWQHSCALDVAGAAWCWGFNYMGEVGSDRYTEYQVAPLAVPGGHVFTEVQAGQHYSCGLTAAGAAHCWGWGDRGQLGATPPACRPGPLAGLFENCSPVPLAVAAPIGLRALSTGGGHACALSADARALCWGDNGQGQLGRPGFGTRVLPGEAGTRTWSTVEAGANTCALAVDGTAHCWGVNAWGVLGTGTRVDTSTDPLPVAGGRRYVALTAGAQHWCALTAEGSVYCWGDDTFGQMGR